MRRHNSYKKGHNFEAFCCKLFSRMGYDVERSILTGDGGIDISMKKNGKRIGVECKNERSNAGRPYVQKLHSAALMRDFNEAWLVTSADFSTEAVEYAAQVNRKYDTPKIRLVNGRQLKQWDKQTQKHGFNFKFAAVVLLVTILFVKAYSMGLIN